MFESLESRRLFSITLEATEPATEPVETSAVEADATAARGRSLSSITVTKRIDVATPSLAN